MARYNEILTGRYNRLTQKLLSMKGSASLVSVDDSMQAVLPLFHGVENRYLEAWENFGVTFQSPVPGAGAFAVISFRNPSNSGVVAVFYKISVFNTAAEVMGLSVFSTSADLDTIISPAAARFDRRGRTNSALIISRTVLAVAAIGPTHWVGQINSNLPNLDVISTDLHEIPLLPGDAVQFGPSVATQTLNTAVWWRERLLEESERA